MTRARIGDEQRRARLALRHRLAAGTAAGDPVEVVRSLVVLHSSDPVTVFVSIWARSRDVDPRAIERALYDERELVRTMGMRRTLYVMPRDLLGAVQSGTTEQIAARERRRVIGMLDEAGVADDSAAWLSGLEAVALERIAARGEALAIELGADDPRLRQKVTLARGKRYEADISISTRVLLLLGMEGRIVRGRPRGTWISSQYRWSTAEAWLGAPIDRPPAASGRAETARRWLSSFGPGTIEDLRWWSGWSVRDVNAALAALGAVEVELEAGVGFVLPDDTQAVAPPEPAATLLPALDATTMGWAGRDWYLGPHRARLFDTNGNAGPTIWWDGRVVGGWAQRATGEIATCVLEDVGAAATAAVGAEAERLRTWLGAVRFTPRFRTPLERELRE